PMRRPTKRQSSVLAQPDVDERRDTDDRYDDVADDAAEEIERGVQKRHADVGDQDGQCGAKAAVACGVEDHPAEDRRPEAVAERSQQSPNELVQDDSWQRKKELIPLDDKKRCERVATALQ